MPSIIEELFGTTAVAFGCLAGVVCWRRRRPPPIDRSDTNVCNVVDLARGNSRNSEAGTESIQSFYTAVSSLENLGSPIGGTASRTFCIPEGEGFSSGNFSPLKDPGAPILLSKREASRVHELHERVTHMGLAGEIAGGSRWYERCELLRYTRARKTVDESLIMYQDAMARRARHTQVWGVDVSKTGSFGSFHEAWLFRADEHEPPAWWTFCRKYLMCETYGCDRNGLPITYFALGRADLSGIIREVGLESVQKFGVYQNDYFLDLARTATSAHDAFILSGVVIVDMEGLSYWDMKSKVQNCNAISTASWNLHPERQRRSFIINAPRTFSVMWRMIQAFLDERSAAKTVILSVNDSLKPLFDEIGADNVPDFLPGGRCQELPRCHFTHVGAGAFANHQRAGNTA